MKDDTKNKRTPLLSCEQAAQYAGKSVHVIRRARAAGHLVGFLPRGSKRGWRYRKQDLDDWLMGTSSL